MTSSTLHSRILHKSSICVLIPLYNGYTFDQDQAWSNFKYKTDGEETLKTTTLDAALICQRDDITSSIGLNFSALIDTFIKTDKNGHYFLGGTVSTEDEEKMCKAVQRQLDDLKSNKRFAASFTNPFI